MFQRVHVHMYIHMYTHIHIYTYVYILTHRVYTYVYTFAHIYNIEFKNVVLQQPATHRGLDMASEDKTSSEAHSVGQGQEDFRGGRRKIIVSDAQKLLRRRVWSYVH